MTPEILTLVLYGGGAIAVLSAIAAGSVMMLFTMGIVFIMQSRQHTLELKLAVHEERERVHRGMAPAAVALQKQATVNDRRPAMAVAPRPPVDAGTRPVAGRVVEPSRPVRLDIDPQHGANAPVGWPFPSGAQTYDARGPGGLQTMQLNDTLEDSRIEEKIKTQVFEDYADELIEHSEEGE